jgi:hypothetical protein
MGLSAVARFGVGKDGRTSLVSFWARQESRRSWCKRSRAVSKTFAHVEPWTTSFNPGTTTLERLLELTREVDFAAFVFAR